MQHDSGSAEGTWFRRNRTTFFVLLGLVLLAGALRVAFNYGPAVHDGDFRFAGNDDYYHLRVVQYVQTEGQHLSDDPLLNYPLGAINPRPPLFDWTHALIGQVISPASGMEPTEAGAYALQWGSALWGMLTVIPIWLIGRAVYSNRAGLWAAFLVAASPAHIQRGGYGLGDHDAFILFFMALGIYFLIRALQLTRDDTRVRTWGKLSSIAEGFGTYADTHRLGLAYAFLTGVSFAAIALAWEGYPYVLAAYAVYYGLQILSNQIRRRDSTGDLLVMMIIFATVTFAALPYYWSIGNISATLVASSYIWAGLILASLILVPTRDLPSLLVLPAAAGVFLLALLVVTFAFPEIGRQIFSANGYFAQSKLYSTIAEAQRTELGVFVFSIGFMTFFLALIGFCYAVARYFKRHERDQLFIVGWGLLSIYMAFAATRFVFNAAPVFAILAGWMVDKVINWMNWRERMRDYRANRHDSFAKAIRSTMGAKTVMGALFLGIFLIIPNVWFSFDAGFSAENRGPVCPGTDRTPTYFCLTTGAFGQSFLDDDWTNTYKFLEKQDAVDANGNAVPCDKRPGHIAWWDYGFWEVAIACHPTVADNFQNGVALSGRFLTGPEKEGIEWMTVRLLEGHYLNNGNTFQPAVRDAITAQNASLLAALTPAHWTRYDDMQKALAQQTNSTEGAAEFYMEISRATGDHIGYLITDFRMFPYDDPRTQGQIDSGSIFYAPTFLSGKNPDDFVQTVYVAQGGAEYRVLSYENDTAGGVKQLRPTKIIGPDGKQYFADSANLIRSVDGERIDYNDNNGQGRPIQGIKLDLKAPFYSTMFYRGYAGGDGQPPGGGQLYHQSFENAGEGLKHWRLVHIEPTVRLLKFSLGVPLTGQISYTQANVSIPGATVAVYDEFGIVHDSANINPDGSYRVLLPASSRNETTNDWNDITVRVERAGVEISNRTFKVTDAQANRQAPFTANGDFNIQPGNLDVFAFIDRDFDRQYNASVDQPATNGNITWDQYSAALGSDGHARLGPVLPGGNAVSGNLQGYAIDSTYVTVAPGQTATANVSFHAAPVTLNGTATLENGTKAPAGLRVNVTAKNPSTEYTKDVASGPTVDSRGNFTTTITQPGGTYILSIDETRVENNVNVRYTATKEVDVPIGAGLILTDLRVQRA